MIIVLAITIPIILAICLLFIYKSVKKYKKLWVVESLFWMVVLQTFLMFSMFFVYLFNTYVK